MKKKDIGLDDNFSCETYDFNWIKLFVQSTQNRIDELSNPIHKLSSWQDPFMLLLLLENVKKINSIEELEEYKKGLIDKMNYFIQRNPSYNYFIKKILFCTTNSMNKNFFKIDNTFIKFLTIIFKIIKFF